MINHARTLLLNQARSRTHSSDLGYEYVPAEFRPVMLPTTLNMIRQILMGAKPDNYFLNYRCRELLSYIHTTELKDYIYNLDPRVTYWPETSKQFFEPTSKRVAITQTYGLPQKITVTGNLRSLNAAGRAYNQYTLDLYKDTNEQAEQVVRVRLTPVGERAPTIIETITSVQAPPVITLPQTEVKLRLVLRTPLIGTPRLLDERNNELKTESPDDNYSKVITTQQPAINRVLSDSDALLLIQSYQTIMTGSDTNLLGRWFIETKVTPDPVLTSAIPALELIGEPANIELFGVENKEPYLTFKNLWLDHPLPTYRLSGIVLALIYRTEELRNQNG